MDPLKLLYPLVNEKETPLPRCWSPTDKYPFLGVSHGNLRVTYRGQGKNHKDAAAVRAFHAIPATCGLYYFEVTIVSKGRDGYMGIGLCQKDVSMNRLPGWDRCSYGYHGDDGNFFCSSGSGVPYGPTFTTGDVIGCGLNLVDNTVFYTKNGQNLGVAFKDLPPDLYPTVGLQTPGEIVDTNFGQEPFLYDIYADIREAQVRVITKIKRYWLPVTKSDWMNKLVSSYLVHHGYCATAESFNKATGQSLDEDQQSIKTRQGIQQLVLGGRIGDAIDAVNRHYPGLLDRRPSLLFTLKCRQFVEIVAGTDSTSPRPRTAGSVDSMKSGCDAVAESAAELTSYMEHSSSKSPRCTVASSAGGAASAAISSIAVAELRQRSRLKSPRLRHYHSHSSPQQQQQAYGERESSEECSDSHNGVAASHASANDGCMPADDCAPMDVDQPQNGHAHHEDTPGAPLHRTSADESGGDSEMNGSAASISAQSSGGLKRPMDEVHRLLEFGRDVAKLSKQLRPTRNNSGQTDDKSHQKKMVEAFSLMAYSDPWNSPQGYLLEASQREPVATALNSAILEEKGLPSRPPLERLVNHAEQLRRHMASAGLGAAAFADAQLLWRSPPPTTSAGSPPPNADLLTPMSRSTS